MEQRTARLRVRPDPRHLTVARSFLAATLRLQGAPEATIDDLRIALSELLTPLITEGREGIEVEISTTPPIVVSIQAGDPPPDLDEQTAELVQRLTEGRLAATGTGWSIEVVLD
jgi:anti-sigma regulatory factor (Ser/Thr protein kinase)